MMETELRPKVKLPIYQLIDTLTLANLSLAPGSDRKNEVMDLSGRDEFPFHGVFVGSSLETR